MSGIIEDYLDYDLIPADCPNCGRVMGLIRIVVHHLNREREVIAITATAWCPECHNRIKKLPIVDPNFPLDKSP